MSHDRKPLVLIPQHFGCLVFERTTSRYLPFDQEATALLHRLRENSIDEVLRESRVEDQDAILAFVKFHDRRGFFDLRGMLDADVLDVEAPPDHFTGPLAVHLEIIGACNLTCTHCFAGELPRNHDPLTLPELDHLFEELAGLGAFRLGLTGGEPLLRRDLLDVLDSATAHGLHPCITTNALLIDESIARELGKRSLIWLNVSLEGPSAEINDPIRGEGTFDQVMSKLKILRDHARYTLAFTITRNNAHLVRECAELACEMGAHTAVFRPLYPVGIAQQHLDLMPSFEQYVNALNDLASLEMPGADLRGLDSFSPETRAETGANVHTSHTCGAGNHVCSISVQGDVNPCSFLGPAFNAGNVRELPFAEIWRNSQQMRRMRDQSESEFQGGCRARAQTFAGSVDAADPWYEQHRHGDLHPGSNVEVCASGDGRFSLPLR